MKKGLTELVFILDRSGSMSGMESDTIGGFNSMLAKQKKTDNDVIVSTILFNHQSKVIHDRVNIHDVPQMTEEDYTANGSTSLLDALGGSIKHIRNVHRYIREEDVPEHTLFVITTDGFENSSHKYDSDTVKKMVKEQQEKGWEFLYLAANIDAVETARDVGIERNRAADYHNDRKGIRESFAGIATACCMLSRAGKIEDAWRDNIDEDFKKRKKR